MAKSVGGPKEFLKSYKSAWKVIADAANLKGKPIDAKRNQATKIEPTQSRPIFPEGNAIQKGRTRIRQLAIPVLSYSCQQSSPIYLQKSLHPPPNSQAIIQQQQQSQRPHLSQEQLPLQTASLPIRYSSQQAPQHTIRHVAKTRAPHKPIDLHGAGFTIR